MKKKQWDVGLIWNVREYISVPDSVEMKGLLYEVYMATEKQSV